MILYHGTTDKATESIKEVGLTWETKSRFRTTWVRYGEVFTQPDSDIQAVHLTPSYDLAKWYALFRVKYAALPVGEHEISLTVGEVSRDFDLIKKPGDAVNGHYSPVVLEFNLPESFVAQHFDDDPEDYNGLISDVPIPARYLVKTHHVHETKAMAVGA